MRTIYVDFPFEACDAPEVAQALVDMGLTREQVEAPGELDVLTLGATAPVTLERCKDFDDNPVSSHPSDDGYYEYLSVMGVPESRSIRALMLALSATKQAHDVSYASDGCNEPVAHRYRYNPNEADMPLSAYYSETIL